MSNIGYGVYETLTIAHDLLTKGATRVICTVSIFDQPFTTDNENYDHLNNPVMFQNKVIEIGETFDFNLYDDEKNVVRVKLIAKDHGADYGITLEVSLS